MARRFVYVKDRESIFPNLRIIFEAGIDSQKIKPAGWVPIQMTSSTHNEEET